MTNLIKWKFGKTKEMADAVAKRVVDGKKTATTGLLAWKSAPNFPHLNQESYITNFDGEPQCVVIVTKIVQMKFKDVSKDHAAKEDDDNPSYEHWRKVHIEYFKSIKPDFSEDDEVICLEFKVLTK